MDIKISYGFIKYDTPKVGVFNIDTNKYSPSEGWIQREEEYKIIGETNYWYVYRLSKSSHDEWVGDKVIERRYILPIGIHKTRLARWVAGQLTLFD